MNENVAGQIAALGDMKTAVLRQRYLEVFKEPSNSRNAASLARGTCSTMWRTPWRL